MIQTKRKPKKKITIDGLKYKIDRNVFTVIENLENQLGNHTLALYNYIEIYNTKETHTDMETILYKYCMQLPHAEAVEEEIKNPTQDEPENND
tara:strand:+ start:642 stop:920 length:279 start_codon:yes stop_codon:yes gene_type:complete